MLEWFIYYQKMYQHRWMHINCHSGLCKKICWYNGQEWSAGQRADIDIHVTVVYISAPYVILSSWLSYFCYQRGDKDAIHVGTFHRRNSCTVYPKNMHTVFALLCFVVVIYNTLMVILPMPCWGCRVKPHGMAVPSDAFTHIIPFLFIFSIWWKI